MHLEIRKGFIKRDKQIFEKDLIIGTKEVINNDHYYKKQI